jgi:hypothetical protein
VASAADDKAEKSSNWQTIEVLDDKECTVRLRILRKASLADVDWMRVEVENTGKKPLAVDFLDYQIESNTYDLKTNALRSSGGLAQRQYSNFSIDASRTWTEPSEFCSDYSATLLGLPSRDGWRVRAKMHFRISLKDGRELKTPQSKVKGDPWEGVPFTFDWLYPTEAGFEAMRVRLKKLLQNPKYEFNHGYILSTYLTVPEVARIASREDLLAALTPRLGSVDGRDAVLGNLLQRYANDPVVKSYFHERLKAGDYYAVNDVGAEVIWDKTFIKPMVRLLQSDYSKYQRALEVLHYHRADWKSDKALPRQLSNVVRGAYPELENKEVDLSSPHFLRWRMGVEALAMTGDHEAIRLLSPALDNKQQLFTGLGIHTETRARHKSMRICDAALDSILTILDGKPDDAYAKAGVDEMLAKHDTEVEWTALRNRMIADLKLRLKGDKKDSPRPAPNPHKQN